MDFKRFIKVKTKIKKGFFKILKLIDKRENTSILYNKDEFRLRNYFLYIFSKDIFEYLLKNNINVDKFIENLDDISQNTVKLILNRVKYIYTHNFLDKKKLTSYEESLEGQKVAKFISIMKKQFKLNLQIYDSSVFYYSSGLKFLSLKEIEFLINKDFIDGGAFIGDSSLIYEKFYHPKKIYAFEPEIQNYNLIFKTIEENNLKKIIPVHKGLGKKEEILNISFHGPSSFIDNQVQQKASIITLDKFVFENNLNVGFIKLDIEGLELEALRSAKQTIKTFKPILSIAIYHNGREFFETMYEIRSICSDYKFIIRKLNPFSPFFETFLIAWYDPQK